MGIYLQIDIYLPFINNLIQYHQDPKICTIFILASDFLVLILNLRYANNINLLILTIYPEFHNLVIIISKNQV